MDDQKEEILRNEAINRRLAGEQGATYVALSGGAPPGSTSGGHVTDARDVPV